MHLLGLVFALLTTLFVTSSGQSNDDGGSNCPLGDMMATVEELRANYEDMVTVVRDLARQTMLQQLFVEERIRSDGDSGVKVIRGGNKGSDNYHGNSHVGNSFDAVHDHSNYDRTVGMGETIVVLNGVEFRTRHNDYKLKMPSTSSTEYHATEDIPFPQVPPAVRNMDSVEDQINEMREWFKAFKDQNTTVRDYRPYFKPTLCYLEGAWTLDQDLEEPFESDRHQIDASSWFQLQEYVRYASYTGTKSRLENYAYLPTTIMAVNNTDGRPNYAQWNYRIVCKPLPDGMDIPLSFLKQADDIGHRFPRTRTEGQIFYTRGARFRLDEHSVPQFNKYGFLDEIFFTIPGKDNVPDELRQESFGEKMYEMGDGDKELNTGYYHRWFKFGKPGAMGLTNVARGFNDENLWVAQTTQNRVAPIPLEVCKKVKVGGKKRKVCETYYTRFSYAIPLEIIYLTPLLAWNPYNLYQHQSKTGAIEGGRNGRDTSPYNGTDLAHHYLTPAEFFAGKTDKSDPADTVKNLVHVLDQNGNTRRTVASGTRIILQSIEGVGKVRLRYPIAPVHGEGSSVWKELNALKTMIKDISDSGQPEQPTVVEFETATTNRPMEHFHEFMVSYSDYLEMKEESLRIKVTTSQAQGHTHDLVIAYSNRRNRFEYVSCDSNSSCWDGHKKALIERNDSDE